jgi:hypothetical protein
MTEPVATSEADKPRKTWPWWLLFLALACGAAYLHFTAKYEASLARIETSKQTVPAGSPDMPSTAKAPKPTVRPVPPRTDPAMPTNLAPAQPVQPAPAFVVEPVAAVQLPVVEVAKPLSPRELAYEQRQRKFEQRSETQGVRP